MSVKNGHSAGSLRRESQHDRGIRFKETLSRLSSWALNSNRRWQGHAIITPTRISLPGCRRGRTHQPSCAGTDGSPPSNVQVPTLHTTALVTRLTVTSPAFGRHSKSFTEGPACKMPRVSPRAGLMLCLHGWYKTISHQPTWPISYHTDTACF